MQNKRITGLYMAVNYHPWSVKAIGLIAKDLGITLDNGPDGEYLFHTTICYMKFKGHPKTLVDKVMDFTSINGSTMFEKKRPKIQVPIKIIGFGFFDTPDGRNFHMKVSSNFLMAEFNRAKRYGIKYSYPKYEPHITLKNDVPKDFKVPPEIERKYKNTILYTNDEYIEGIQN